MTGLRQPPSPHPLEQYLAPVYALCYRLLEDPVLAEDAAQETFLQAIKIWHQFVPPAPASATADRTGKDPRLQWLLAIAARRALHLRRTARRFVPFVESAMSSNLMVTPSSAAERAELTAQLEAALRGLPEDERQAVVLHHVTGLTQAEIAEALELPARTVSHRISDGLAALRKRLEAQPAPAAAAHVPARERWAALSVLLLQLPAPAPQAGLAARLFAHPDLLTWTAPSTAATASTATAGSTGSTAGSFTATTTTSKGATIMSMKFAAAATAALGGVLAAFWIFSGPTPRPGAPSDAPGQTAQTPSGNSSRTAAFAPVARPT
ncbi:MAG TPA: sigma-70 family RNA polymerase sigma factor, partial [Planctomycetota bacterium]|nr:sigma-70 family RNA polymerase sigma factor [Planctomycetota bacterium]